MRRLLVEHVFVEHVACAVGRNVVDKRVGVDVAVFSFECKAVCFECGVFFGQFEVQSVARKPVVQRHVV